MPEPKCSPHGWTLDTLEKYLSIQIKLLNKLVKQHDSRNVERFASKETAVKIASDATKEASDKFAADLKERLKPLESIMSRQEYDSAHKLLEKDVSAINVRLTALEANDMGRRSGLSLVGQIMLGVIAAAALVVSYFRH